MTTAAELFAGGVSRRQLAAEVAAGRWRRAGHAIVLHNGLWSEAQRIRIALVHAGPGAVLTAFTAAEVLGVAGWPRDAVHVLARAGTRQRERCPVPVRLHRCGPAGFRCEPGRTIELLPDALVRATASLDAVRPGCGLLAAAVQKRRVTAADLRAALERATRTRHRAALLTAVADIEGGAQALSEIDFGRLCRRHRLPPPDRQTVRREASGRRRYLDATWRRADGRLVVAEVDGALHLSPRRWWDDQARQNEITLGDALVLRFPSVVLRTDPGAVASQLRRALQMP